MNNSSKNANPRYPIEFVVGVFPLVMIFFVVICVSHALLIIFLSLKFQLPAAVGFCILFATGLPLYMWCYFNAIVKWQIWAYNSVVDIRELDAMQFLLSFLCIEDYDNHEIWLSAKDIASRKAILDRYYGPYYFEDDLSVRDSYTISNKGINAFVVGQQFITISNEGIKSPNGTFYGWDRISEEEVIYDRHNRKEWAIVFSYKCPGGLVEIPAKSLKINSFRLKHLLYVYRSRHSISTGKLVNVSSEITAQKYTTPLPYNASIGLPQPKASIGITLVRVAQKTYGLLIATLLILLLTVVHKMSSNITTEKRLKEHYSGIVIDKKHYKYSRRGTSLITLAGQRDDIEINHFRYFDSISVGDYISKKEGEIKRIIVKGSDTLVFDDENYY